MRLTVSKPGALTRVYKGPVGLYHTFPSDDINRHFADDSLQECDGLILVVAAAGDWRFVLSSSGKLGWVFPDDLGVQGLCDTVYHLPWAR